MPFNSLEYFLFLPVVYLVFYVVGERARWSVLLAASLLFYAALNVPYLLVVLILVTATTYSFGIWLDQADTPKAKRALVWGGIAANILILIVMKYLPFLSENLKALSALLSLDANIQPINIFVSIGVSYYVFQAISYLVDIYLEIEKPERHLGYFALHLAFFPKLLQGPIERAGDLIPQLKTRYEFNYDNMRFGMLLFTWGLFKKVVIADRLALLVNPVFSDVHSYTGVSLILATYLYSIQIFCDFSGYTDMALGTARLFNIHLTQNFNSPYLATSVVDFWRRWHISFSRWILDYIFKPLQIQLRDWRTIGTALALLVTFFVSGIWHGASWGFVIWGILHGTYLAASTFYKPYKEKIYRTLRLEKSWLRNIWQTVFTFHLVCFSWIFFRANTTSDAFYIVTHFVGRTKSVKSILDEKNFNMVLSIVFIIILIFTPFISENKKQTFYAKPLWYRWLIYCVLVSTVILFNCNAEKAFIYFNF